MNERGKQTADYTLDDLVFVGLNSRVMALDRYTGETLWTWKSPKGSGFPTVLLDGDRLVAAVNGYVYCLDPLYGQEVWQNQLKGMGLGVASVTSVRGTTSTADANSVLAAQRAAAAAAAAG